MYCIYIIQNDSSKEIYIGKTNNLQKRLKQHNSGQQKSTKRLKGKWILVYAEAYRDKQDASEREKKLKQHGSNKRWLLERIKRSKLED